MSSRALAERIADAMFDLVVERRKLDLPVKRSDIRGPFVARIIAILESSDEHAPQLFDAHADLGGKPRTVPRRNALLDAMVALDGSDPGKATSSAFATAATALRQIRESEPEVTADQLRARADAYRRKFPNAAIAPMGFAKHWASLAPPPSLARVCLPEPAGWRAWLDAERPESTYATGRMMGDSPWPALDLTTQRYIAEAMSRETA